MQLHQQLTRLQQKPLLRLAGWLDRRLPENGFINRSLHNLLAALSILRHQGWRALLNRLRNKSQAAWKPRSAGVRASLEAMRSGEPFELNPGVAEAVLHLAVENPPHQPDVLILPFIDWEFRIQRPQHLATQLALHGQRVFYLHTQPASGKYPQLKQLQPNLYLLKLPAGETPLHYQSTLTPGDVEWLRRSLSTVMDAFNMHTVVLKVDMPFWQLLALRLQAELGWKLVYDCMDEHAGFSHNSAMAVHDQQLLLEHSDLVLFSSAPLLERHSTPSMNALRLPNAVDFDLFHPAANPLDSELLNRFKPPIIGYYGAIADWFDGELVRQLAAAHPEWSFVLIGATDLADLRPLRGLPNIHLLGEKPYPEIPKYLSAFDACIIPFKQGALTHATNPVKLFEFMAASKPVVATKLDELSRYAAQVTLASNFTEWDAALRQALAEDKTPALLESRYEFARRNTWPDRWQTLTAALTRLYPPISIVIVTYNQLEYTRLCLESITQCSGYPNYELILVDNASSDGTVETLTRFRDEHPGVTLIANSSNLGFAAANNLGARAAQGDFLVFLNNDTLVTPGWLQGLLTCLQRDPSTGMVGPMTNDIGNEARLEVDYRDPAESRLFAARRLARTRGQSFEIRMLALYCAMLPRALYEQVGGMDERYGIGMFEDDDLALSLKSAGRSLVCARDVFIHHFHGVSFKQLDEKAFQRLFEENRLKFEHKWGVAWQPHQPGKGA